MLRSYDCQDKNTVTLFFPQRPALSDSNLETPIPVPCHEDETGSAGKTGIRAKLRDTDGYVVTAIPGTIA